MKAIHRRWLQAPSWQWNVLILGVFAVVVIFYGSWQIKQNRASFRQHALNQTQLIAGILERNAHQSATAGQLYQDIVGAFLSSTADFILYLDSIEPFRSDELAAFAWENNLALIRLERHDGSLASYPESPPDITTNGLAPGLHHRPEEHLYLLVVQHQNQHLVLAVPAFQLEQLQQQLSQEQLLILFSQLPGIAFVRTESLAAAEINLSSATQFEVQLREDMSPPVAEAQLRWSEDQILVFGLEATLYEQRRKALYAELGGLVAVLIVSGGLLSRLLYNQQRRMVVYTKNFERKLAHQHEEAALGRAAESISHEIRNPLNAISMGLQRIEMEANLDPEHARLIHVMSQALERTSDTISQLQRFARPLLPNYQRVDLAQLIHHLVSLYQTQTEQQQVVVATKVPDQLMLEVDPLLIYQVLENLLKNAIEAMPDGGRITIEVDSDEQWFVLDMTNPTKKAFNDTDLFRLQEPYVTDKTRGTGLGLPMVKKIVNAHHGNLSLLLPRPGFFCARMMLPVHPRHADNKE